MATYYRWNRYNTEKEEGTSTVSSITASYHYYASDSKPTMSSNGTYSFTLDGNVPSGTSGYNCGNYVAFSATASKMYYYNRGVRAARGEGASTATYDGVGGGDLTVYEQVRVPTTSNGYVYSINPDAYPEDGASGIYYYDSRTTVTSPTAPSGITYPASVTTPSVSVSWTAATSNTNYAVNQYEVSYSTNGGSSWTVAGTTSSTSYSFTVPAGTTSIMFRVRAKDSNSQWGDYVTGTASQVLLAPTLTVPQMVMQGQQATISWTAVEGADSYTLQRKADTDADWTQVYSGANLSYTETVGTWTSLQYRVQGVFDGTPGGWATSGSIPVVSSSALVISGTDGDLGTLVSDVPYSISTDTGNQITAQISVNGTEIFSGNVANGAASTIPVLDLPTGEGSIVISASVTAASGAVNATRSWTYTKTPITFPGAGSVAQLTRQGANIWPKTLAEAVRTSPLFGGTLDKTLEMLLPYIVTFSADDWEAGTSESTITIPKSVHERSGDFVVCRALSHSAAVYHERTFAAMETYATIDEDGDVTLHYPDTTGYAGAALLYIYPLPRTTT